jgi:hypothetical protein
MGRLIPWLCLEVSTLTGLRRSLTSSQGDAHNPFRPITVARTATSLYADEEVLEENNGHTFGTYKHPEFGSADEAYALKRQITDTVSEYLPNATMPSPRESLSDTANHHQINRTS